jgi:MFS family permease
VYLSAAARAVSVGGDFVAATALLLAFQDRGFGGYAVGALLVAEAVPLVLFAPLGGRLADRYDSRTILVTVALAQTVLCGVLAWSTSPWLLISAIFLLTCGVAVSQPTWSALTPDMVGRDNLPRAAAIGQTGAAMGMLTGPALAGVLFGVFGGATVPLLVDAGSFLAIALAALLVRTRRNHPAPAEVAVPAGSAPPAEVAVPASSAAPAGFRLRQDPMLVTIVVSLTAVISVLSAVNVADVFFVRGQLGASAVVYGIIAASWAAGTMGGSWAVAGRSWSDARWTLTMLAILGVLSAVVFATSQVPVAWPLIPLSLLGGAFNGALNVTAGVVPSRRVPAAYRGRVFGRIGSLANAANVVGYVAGGLLVGPLSAQHVIALSSLGGMLVVTGLLPVMLRAVRAAGQPSGPAVSASTGDRVPEAGLASH